MYREGGIVVIAVLLFRPDFVLAEGVIFSVRVPLFSSPQQVS